jgi:hypothetical protein
MPYHHAYSGWLILGNVRDNYQKEILSIGKVFINHFQERKILNWLMSAQF